MSVFPKRTKPGGCVTIHLAISPSIETDRLLFPKLALDVINPAGEVQRIVDCHLVLVPNRTASNEGDEDNGVRTGLAGGTPLIVLADYLDGPGKRRELADIIKRTPRAMHYYFHYAIPADAIPGKYRFVSEIFLDGKQFLSGTREDDFFLVEKLSIGSLEKNKDGKPISVSIRNHSPEPTPVLVIRPANNGEGRSMLMEVPGFSETSHPCDGADGISFLYNEGREALFAQDDGNRIVRNQTLVSFDKKDGEESKTYVMFPESEDAYILSDGYKDLWDEADGFTLDTELAARHGKEVFEEMLSAALVTVMDRPFLP